MVHDSVKVDEKAEFRLAPITRRKRIIKRQAIAPTTPPKLHVKKQYTKNFDPIPIWPQEFRACRQCLKGDKAAERQTHGGREGDAMLPDHLIGSPKPHWGFEDTHIQDPSGSARPRLEGDLFEPD